MENKVEFCANPEGARIAYTTLGNGPAFIFPPADGQLLGMYMPGIRAAWEYIARYHRVVLYDARGFGLSERTRADFTFESELRDLQTVIDHLKLEKVILVGNSRAGPFCIAYAVRHPERVTHLILYGSYAYYGKYVSDTVKSSILALSSQQDNWLGFRTVTSMMNPNWNADQTDFLIEVAKKYTTPDTIARFLEMFYTFDVTDLCPRVTVPTLIVHPKNDMLVDFRAGLELASLIPNARFVPWGGTHWGNLTDKEMWHVVLEFLGDPVPKEPAYDIGKLESSSLVASPKTEQRDKNWMRMDNPLVFIIVAVVTSVIAGIILMMIKC